MLLAAANDITKDLRIWHGDAYIVEEEVSEELAADGSELPEPIIV